MPVEKDLKKAFTVLYDEREPLKALQLYDTILKDHPENLIATIYKAAALEKLYYGFADWHNDQTLESAKELLDKALKLAEARGDRTKLGLVHFRHFIHHINDKEYSKASESMAKYKEFGYKDDTLPMWEAQLDRKLKKASKKPVTKSESLKVDPVAKEVAKPQSVIITDSQEVKTDEKLRTDWYQTQSDVVLSLFTLRLPQSERDVKVQVDASHRKQVEISFPIPVSGSEFQYSVTLAHEVNPNEVKVKTFTKKLEVTFKKDQNGQWKSLEDQGSSLPQTSSTTPTTLVSDAPLNYPSSSKKHIDWSKIDLDDDNDGEGDSADAFFQKLYADADPDTKRAMMKSFVESNGTALNTDWEDVSKKKVDASPPEGMEIKEF